MRLPIPERLLRILPLALLALVLEAGAATSGPLQLAQADGLRLPESRRMAPDLALTDGLSGTQTQDHATFSLGEQWSGRWAATQSPGPAAFQRHSMSGQIERSLADGWGLGVGLRRNDYQRHATHALTLSAQKQWGELRGSYTLLAGLTDGHAAESHRLGLSYRQDQRNSWALALMAGREPDQYGLLRGFSAAELYNWSLGGQHRLSGAFALTYDIVSGAQGSVLPRTGLRFGLRHDF